MRNMKLIIKLLIFGIISCLCCYFIWTEYKDVSKEKTTCEFVKTYQVLNVVDSNDNGFVYITLRAFQQEEVATVKVEKTEYPYISGENYEFKFRKEDKIIKENIDSIFLNSKFISAVTTNKKGLDQIQNPVCK